MRAGTPGCPDVEDWLADQLPPGARVGVDPYVHTVDAVRRLQRKLEVRQGGCQGEAGGEAACGPAA